VSQVVWFLAGINRIEAPLTFMKVMQVWHSIMVFLTLLIYSWNASYILEVKL